MVPIDLTYLPPKLDKQNFVLWHFVGNDEIFFSKLTKFFYSALKWPLNRFISALAKAFDDVTTYCWNEACFYYDHLENDQILENLLNHLVARERSYLTMPTLDTLT